MEEASGPDSVELCETRSVLSGRGSSRDSRAPKSGIRTFNKRKRQSKIRSQGRSGLCELDGPASNSRFEHQTMWEQPPRFVGRVGAKRIVPNSKDEERGVTFHRNAWATFSGRSLKYQSQTREYKWVKDSSSGRGWDSCSFAVVLVAVSCAAADAAAYGDADAEPGAGRGRINLKARSSPN